MLDPLESRITRAIYVNALSHLNLNFNNDFKAAEVAGEFCSIDPDVLWGLDWSQATIYMPPYSGELNPRGLVVAVEGYTLRRLLQDGLNPDIVITDFDYEPSSLMGFRGIVIGHAHGDNISSFIKYAKFMNRLIPSVQVWPVNCSIMIPGFTDGDRAVYLAAYMGARHIVVRGFNPGVVVKRDDEVKRVKLMLAGYFIKRASRLTNVEVHAH